jgi:hypothetical protein
MRVRVLNGESGNKEEFARLHFIRKKNVFVRDLILGD